jgi:hypothetical protein
VHPYLKKSIDAPTPYKSIGSPIPNRRNRSEAPKSFWAISTLVCMGHGAQIFWNQSRSLLYLVFFYTWVHIGIEESMHLDQCGSSMCLDQCLEMMYF